VTRARLFGGRCACCGERAVATAPEGLEPGSPFGKSIEAVAVYFHDAQAIGLARLMLQMIDSTVIRAHCCAAGLKGGSKIRRSAGTAAVFPPRSICG
jgi:hypothetical protein